jgi:hypothetical protein
MSRSVIACRDCKLPVAVKHHNGEIVAAEGLRASTHTTGDFRGTFKVVCTCGRPRYFTPVIPTGQQQAA